MLASLSGHRYPALCKLCLIRKFTKRGRGSYEESIGSYELFYLSCPTSHSFYKTSELPVRFAVSNALPPVYVTTGCAAVSGGVNRTSSSGANYQKLLNSDYWWNVELFNTYFDKNMSLTAALISPTLVSLGKINKIVHINLLTPHNLLFFSS